MLLPNGSRDNRDLYVGLPIDPSKKLIEPILARVSVQDNVRVELARAVSELLNQARAIHWPARRARGRHELCERRRIRARRPVHMHRRSRRQRRIIEWTEWAIGRGPRLRVTEHRTGWHVREHVTPRHAGL